jgi:hypothetical protein
LPYLHRVYFEQIHPLYYLCYPLPPILLSPYPSTSIVVPLFLSCFGFFFCFANPASTNGRKYVLSVFVGLAYFTQHNDLQCHSIFSTWHNFILLNDWVKLHPVSMPHFLHSSVDRLTPTFVATEYFYHKHGYTSSCLVSWIWFFKMPRSGVTES